MQPNRDNAKVIIRHCGAYDPERIRTIVREGLAELGLRPRGRTLLKPNLVMAGPNFEDAYTRPEFTEGVLRGLQDCAPPGALRELAVGERCGITVPTRYVMEQSGTAAMIKRQRGVKLYCFEEEPQVEIRYTHPQRLRDYVFTPEPVARADFFVNCPKFKAHPWTTVTFGNKAYIGLQDDRHRLIDHDTKLDQKIADLQYIVQPQFLAIDAIIAGEGRMLTPIPRRLNLIIMGNNQCAFDAVCCRIIGVDPFEVAHIRLAHERGFGPLAPSEIQVSGDVSLEQAQARAHGFKVGLIRVEKYFEGSHVTAYAGKPPASEKTDYCWGGCPGALEEAIEILRKFDAQTDTKLPRMHVVFGSYQGDIDWQPGERVVFIGDCAEWSGQLGGEAIEIDNRYRQRETLDPYTIEGEDALAKMRKTSTLLKKSSGKTALRLLGCPVSVTEQVYTLVQLAGIQDPAQSWDGARAYMTWKTKMLWKRLGGQNYQVRGPTQRGEAAPQL